MSSSKQNEWVQLSPYIALLRYKHLQRYINMVKYRAIQEKRETDNGKN